MSGARRFSAFDKLVSIAPDPSNVNGPIETIDDLERIMALPRRPPFDCQRDPLTKRYRPETQALIEIMTGRFTRGPRLSCACRPRRVIKQANGNLVIARVLPEGFVPEVPIMATMSAFIADNRATAAEIETVRRVSALRPGEETELPAADGEAGHPCITTFNAVQSWTLYEAGQVGGIVAFAGVGSGKTLTWLLAPLLFPDCKLAVVCIEPKQRQHYRSHYMRAREHFRVPSIVYDDGVNGETVPGTPPLHIISYSVLSRTENSDLLDSRDPDTLILDEAHRACGKSAINRRIKRFVADKIRKRERDMAEGKPVFARAVRLLDGSGTLETKSVDDTQMLCAYSLGMGSPLPIDPKVAEAWSAVMDVSRQPDYKSNTAKELYRVFAGKVIDSDSIDDLLYYTPEKDVRRGFCERRIQTPGIITATAPDVGASIYISARDVKKLIPKSIKEALAMVRTDWKRPDGDILKERMDQVECARNVACGFYTYWKFPKHPCTFVHGPETQCDQCLLIADWYEKRKLFNKELRTKQNAGEKYLDSSALCIEAAERFYQDPPYRGEKPIWHCETWPAWRDIENKVEYEEHVQWIDDYLVQDAAAWAKKNKGVLWFSSIPFGRKVSELAGIPYFNGGPGAETRLRAEKGNRSIVCSIPAHGAGTDGLQYIFSTQLIAELPSSNANSRGLEQLLGRLHREGQKADVVKTEIYVHVSELMDSLEKALAEAEFNLEMTKNPQKLLSADIDVKGIE